MQWSSTWLQKLVCYASGQRVGERSAKYGEWDEVESRFMVRYRPNSHDLRYVDRIWVPTSLYAPRRWESKLTSDALFVSKFWAVFDCTEVKSNYRLPGHWSHLKKKSIVAAEESEQPLLSKVTCFSVSAIIPDCSYATNPSHEVMYRSYP